MSSTPTLALALVLNGGLAAALAIYAWPRRRMPGARPFIVINLLAVAASWSYAAYFQSIDIAAREFWIRMRFTGQAALPAAILLLCLELSDRPGLSRRALVFLTAVPALLVAALWTNPWHHLMFVKATIPAAGAPATAFGYTPGPLFWLLMVYVVVSMVVATLALLEHAMRRGGVARTQAFIIVAGVATPAIATVVSMLAPVPGGLLLGPFAYAVSLCLFGVAIFRLGFLDIVPIARATVFEEMSEGVIVFDAARRVVDANGAASRFLGIAGSPVMKRAEDVLAEWPSLLEGFEAGARVSVELRRGGFSLESIVTPLSSAAAPGWLVMIHDVTDARRTEAALQEASRARGDFLARMSHEIRTPMNGVMGLSGLLLQTSLDDRQRQYARGVRHSAQALLRVVNDVLDFSRIDAGRLSLEVSNFEPRQSAAEAIDLVKPDAQAKGLVIRLDTDAEVPFTVAGDAGRLRQILINLLGNAVKFTPAGEVRVHLAADPDGDDLRLRFTVSDSGIGIAPDALERIFQPFVQAETSTASRYGGSGLGLAICRQLVELMGGQIQVRSEVGRGSVFEFTVRVARPRPITTPVLAEDVDETPVRRRWSGRVLVAEDNAVNQLVLVRHLEARGVVADVAASGVEAVDAWARAPYDLMLMDCRMPEMDGYEATREIRRREAGGRRTPIVAMTADALPEYRQRSLDAGMDDHVAKPVSVRELESILARFLRPAAALRPAIDAAALDDIRLAMGKGFDTVADRYLEDASASLDELRGAAARRDDQGVAHAAHRLKGSSGIIAAASVVQVCQRLVDEPRAVDAIDELEGELARVREQLLAVRRA
jgi:signal transduction histidine kinase/CheY-like chemotaxis protein